MAAEATPDGRARLPPGRPSWPAVRSWSSLAQHHREIPERHLSKDRDPDQPACPPRMVTRKGRHQLGIRTAAGPGQRLADPVVEERLAEHVLRLVAGLADVAPPGVAAAE